MLLASLMGKQKATIEEAKEALRDIEVEQELSITTSKIIDCVCRYYKIRKEDLVGKKRNKEIVEPRQICAYIMTKLLNVPLNTIGEALGGRDYSTIISSRDKVSKLVKEDKSLEADINHVIEIIKNES